MGDQERLTAALAEYLTEFGQRRWYVRSVYWDRSKMLFLHAKKRSRSGTDEAMMVARLRNTGRIQLRRYVLLRDKQEWLSCDPEALEGFLEEGPRGLKRGSTQRKPTICNCDWRVHRSGGRAQRYAEELAQRYGKSGVQRAYRCPENPRAFHLTAQEKGSRKLMPGAYIDPDLDG